MRTSLFIGRWQVPRLHAGHKALIQTAIDEGHHVVVAIRDTDLDESNPYPLFARYRAIREAFGDKVEIITIPDSGCDLEICYGRGVGYSFRQIELPPEMEAVSGTAIRQQRRVVWLTGQSGAGKTTLARLLAPPLQAIVLDGDEMRKSISLGMGFSIADRLAHNLRVARLARVLVAQCNVIVSVIAPTPEIRSAVEEIIRPFWVYVKRELPQREGHIYEPPLQSDVTVDSDRVTPEEAVQIVLEVLHS